MTVIDSSRSAAGSWTGKYPELGTGLISYEDSVSPEFHDLEREAVWKRCWLMVGRVEKLPRKGSYFTKEIAIAKTSVLISRDMHGEIHAFHNICRHRGMKLMWNEFPREETEGVCRQFSCKYHGWKYDLDGALSDVPLEEEFFDFDKDKFGLPAVHVDVWQGFIFINLDREPQWSLRDYLGPLLQGIEGYPFDTQTEHYGYKAPINSNWKLFYDAFQEFYHVPVLHGLQNQTVTQDKVLAGIKNAYYEICGPHRVGSLPRGGVALDSYDTGRDAASGTLTDEGADPGEIRGDLLKPSEKLTRSSLIGPWDAPDFTDTAPRINVAGFPQWSVVTFMIFPNTTILLRGAGWYLTYSYWPTAYNRHTFEGDLYFPPSKNASERLSHEMVRATHKEYALQDANTLEGTQIMLESRVVDAFPLSDQEIMPRHLHKEIRDWVERYKNEQRSQGTPVSVG